MCFAYNEKWKKTIEGIEQLNQERIKTLREKENYKYLGKFEVEMKETDRKITGQILKPQSILQHSITIVDYLMTKTKWSIS